ncbi:MAG: hypothetical protein K2J13_01600, partial [Clostridia bacterium]|nr:hypothetical protein [Clostridia bacterium]
PYQTMNGFGASSAWIYQDMGQKATVETKDQAIEMLYGDTGLGLNTFRYNVGAGGSEVDTYEDPLRGGESFFVAENFNGDYSVFADPANYDFEKDAAVRDMFERALATGNIKQIVFFANSPHYLMTLNQKTHGEKIYDNNLKEECYEAFSDYMLVIVNELCKRYVGEDVKVFISPVNEPQWKWGGEGATQEGCHYDPAVLAKFYDVFYKKLKEFNKANSTDYIMDIFESGNYQLIKSTRTKFNEYMTEFEKYDYFKDITHISVHSYGADTSKFYRNIFADYMSKYYPQINVAMSEYCTLIWEVDKSIDMGLRCGKVIMRDLAILNVTDWNHWLSIAKGNVDKGVGDYEDALVYWLTEKDEKHNDAEHEHKEDILDVSKRYFVMGQFSKYISKDSVRIKSGYSDTLQMNGVECVAFENPDGSIALVVLNDSNKSHKIKIKGGYAHVKEIVTNQEENWKISEYENDGVLNVGAKSITTYVFTK